MQQPPSQQPQEYQQPPVARKIIYQISIVAAILSFFGNAFLIFQMSHLFDNVNLSTISGQLQTLQSDLRALIFLSGIMFGSMIIAIIAK
jgi:hypothetical protein